MSTERIERGSTSDDDRSDAQGGEPSKTHASRRITDAQTEEDDDQGDLIDQSPPPLDRPVIVAPTPEQRDRAWLMRAVMISFGITIIGAWTLAAGLPADHWKQVQPLATRGVELLGTLATVIIGFYFGSKSGK